MIRRYQPHDLEQLLEVWARASELAHPFLSEAFLERERYNIPNVYMPVAETWVWESASQVTGFMALVGSEVGGLFVDPACQRSGIGHALLDHARTQRDELEVEVFVKNAIGRAFYKKYGFEPVHQSVHKETGFEILRLRLAGNAPPNSRSQAEII